MDKILAENDGDGTASEMQRLNGDEIEPVIVTMEIASSRLIYGIHKVPSWPVIFLYAIQQILANIGAPIAAVFIIHGQLCTDGHGNEADVFFARLLSTTIFMMGVATCLQVTFGVRLPVLQGSSTSFVVPIVAMTATDAFRCDKSEMPLEKFTSPGNITTNGTFVAEMPWIERMQVINGSLMLASLLQITLGSTGLIGYLMNFVGPLTIAPTVTLIGLSLFQSVNRAAECQWGIAILFVALMVIFSLCLGKLKIPVPLWSRDKGFHLGRSPVFKLFPHIFAITICWGLSHILTVTNILPNDPTARSYRARTDAKLVVIDKASWFFVPYPLQWGGISFSSGVFVGMLAAAFASTIESVGDYYSTARISEVPPPPKHAVNRGIMLEGLACFMASIVGSGHATTSYSGTVGFIGITGVASRIIWQALGVMLIVLGVFGKFGAALSVMPDSIIGGIAIVGFGMVIAVGLSNLQFLDFGSARNLFILGISLLLGLMVPFWLHDNPGIIRTGISELDQVLTVMLGTGMLVGGALGFILDNIIPGTRAERGLLSFHREISIMASTDQSAPGATVDSVYDVPLLSALSTRFDWLSCLPFMPCASSQNRSGCLCRRNSIGDEDNEREKRLSTKLLDNNCNFEQKLI